MAADQILHGGAISNDGTLIITNATFSGNSVTRSTPGNTNALGGAVFANGVTAITTIHNSTFSGNTVSESGTGTASGGSI